jgi:hypothetical protein
VWQYLNRVKGYLVLKKMVQESLVEYCRQLLAQGYDAETIRTTLVNAGYSKFDANDALRAAGANVPSGFHLSGKTLLFVFGGLLVLALLVWLVLLFTGPEPAPLAVSTSILSTQVSAGEEVVINVDVSNPDDRKVSASLEVSVSGPSGVVDVRSESLQLDSSRRVPVRVLIPEGSADGQYGVDVSLSYGPLTVRSSSSFEVRSRVVQQPAGIVDVPVERAVDVSLTCPASCDDLQFCTRDSCVNGVCVNEPIVPCCGNGVCEVGETASSCAVDCAPQVSPQSVIDDAKGLAVANPSGAIQKCVSLGMQFYVDSCLNDVASASNSKAVCEQISSSESRDACLISFAYPPKKDYSVCAQIQDVYLRTSCDSLKDWESRGVPQRPQ